MSSVKRSLRVWRLEVSGGGLWDTSSAARGFSAGRGAADGAGMDGVATDGAAGETDGATTDGAAGETDGATTDGAAGETGEAAARPGALGGSGVVRAITGDCAGVG